MQRRCWIMVGMLCGLSGFAFAQTSPNYAVVGANVNAGGAALLTSSNYRASTTLGQNLSGLASSASFQGELGVQYVYDAATAAGAYRAYLAEGYTKGGFSTIISLYNPNSVSATAKLTFMKEDSTNVIKELTLGANRRIPIDASTVVGANGFSVQLDASAPVVMERSMYWADGKGVANADGHNATAVRSLSRTWYFAEGYNNSEYRTHLLLVNPQSQDAHVTMKFLKTDGTTLIKTGTIRPRTRMAVGTFSWLPAGGFAMQIASDLPILAERAMYWSANGVSNAGGHDTLGAAALATTWYLAEGLTNATNETYILLLNPQPQPVKITATFYKDDGTTQSLTMTLKATSRDTLIMQNILPTAGFGAKIVAEQPIAVERARYWNAGTARNDGGHDTMGATALDTAWHFAEGRCGNGFETYLLLLNPGSGAANVTITFVQDSGVYVTQNVTVPPTSRLAVKVSTLGVNGGFAAKLAANQPIMAERTMYWPAGGVANAGGHCSVGVPQAQLAAPAPLQAGRQYPVNVEVKGNGKVSGDGIDCGTDCVELYPEGTVLNLKAVPASGARFVRWEYNGVTVTGLSPVLSPGTVTAVFE